MPRSHPAGHAVSITPGRTDVHAFWSAPTGDGVRYADLRRYDEQLMELFAEAIRVRLPSRGPVLAELSGGLDSSSVVCMARELARTNHEGQTVDEFEIPTLHSIGDVHTVVLGVPGGGCDGGFGFTEPGFEFESDEPVSW
jgi:asparagine synthetase B (glutamine-hydrolysing)